MAKKTVPQKNPRLLTATPLNTMPTDKPSGPRAKLLMDSPKDTGSGIVSMALLNAPAIFSGEIRLANGPPTTIRVKYIKLPEKKTLTRRLTRQNKLIKTGLQYFILTEEKEYV